MQHNGALPKKTLYIWQIRLGVLGIMVAFVSIFVDLTVTVIAVTVFFAVDFLLLPLWYKSFEIGIDKGLLILSYGLIFRTTYLLPLSKVIYIKLYKTPLNRAFSLCFSVLKTVKGFLILPEMDDKDIKYIKQLIDGEKNEKAY